MSTAPDSLLRPVLYVEDDENDAFLMRHAFGRTGIQHPLVVVTDGQKAIDYLAGRIATGEGAGAEMPCLIILDLNLPHRSGFEVLAWLREQPCFASLLVVIFSSSNHTHDIDKAYALGANAYLVKPPDIRKRMELVGQLREKWLPAAPGGNQP